LSARFETYGRALAEGHAFFLSNIEKICNSSFDRTQIGNPDKLEGNPIFSTTLME
jgi:hypothetical protein